MAADNNGRGKSLILTQQALQKAGYVKEAQSVEAIRSKNNWSDYAFPLIKRLQQSVREHSDIRKLRFLLYPKTLETTIRLNMLNYIKQLNKLLLFLNNNCLTHLVALTT